MNRILTYLQSQHLQSPRWIAWNLFLAVVPVIVGYLLAWWTEKGRIWRNRLPWALWALVWLAIALVWFAFLPNTCYLLTEWRHFLFDPHHSPLRVPGDYTPRSQLAVARLSLFYLCYSAAGVICYTLSIRPVERMIRAKRLNLMMMAVPFFFLISLAVYMGLIVRLNTWQILTQPMIVWQTAFHAVTDPPLIKVIVIFAFLLWLLYETVDIWVDGVVLRLKRGRAVEPAGRRHAKS